MELMVGVSGVRGVVGQTFNPELVLQFAQAYGTLLGGGPVVLARDSRPSGEMYALAAAAGLLAAGSQVTDLGIVMTPTVAHAIRTGGYRGGINVTASHNPADWNGLKFFDSQGIGPDANQIQRMAAIRTQGAYRLQTEGFGPVKADGDAGPRHVRAVLDAVEADVSRLKGKTVVLDSVNGAAGPHSRLLLEALGCRVILLNAEPTGRFAHPPEPLREHLGSLCTAVREAGAMAGFAQDPDGDRLAVVDECGEYIGEEYTLALAAQFVLSRRPGAVAANLSTSRLIDDVAARFGAEVVRTPVGESNVARAILEKGCVVGGEGNGGVIDPRLSLVRDSLSAMSLILQLTATTGKSISRLVADLPRYALIKQKIKCPRDRVDAAVFSVSRAFAEQRLNRTDGVRIDFPEGWVHLRASNTEPVLRVVAEAAGQAAAESLIRLVRQAAGL